jgi:succinate-acetate transporter protein
MLSISFILVSPTKGQNVSFQKAGGAFGLVSAFLAWYVGFAGLADSSNSFFTVPVWHFPWSDKGREAKAKKDDDMKV